MMIADYNSINSLLKVRRWQEWDKKVGKHENETRNQQNGKKQVQFLKGEDGEPWVNMMYRQRRICIQCIAENIDDRLMFSYIMSFSSKLYC